MTPTEIAAQIISLYTQLAAQIADNDTDWDGDYAALLGQLSQGAEAFACALDAVAEKDFESNTWDRAQIKVMGVSAGIADSGRGLGYAAEIAADYQRELADGIAAATA